MSKQTFTTPAARQRISEIRRIVQDRAAGISVLDVSKMLRIAKSGAYASMAHMRDELDMLVSVPSDRTNKAAKDDGSPDLFMIAQGPKLRKSKNVNIPFQPVVKKWAPYHQRMDLVAALFGCGVRHDA